MERSVESEKKSYYVAAATKKQAYCGSTLERSGKGCSSLFCRALASAAWPPSNLPTYPYSCKITPGTPASAGPLSFGTWNP